MHAPGDLAEENEVILHLWQCDSNWNHTEKDAGYFVWLFLCFRSLASLGFLEGGSGSVWNAHLHYIVWGWGFPLHKASSLSLTLSSIEAKQEAIESIGGIRPGSS